MLLRRCCYTLTPLLKTAKCRNFHRNGKIGQLNHQKNITIELRRYYKTSETQIDPDIIQLEHQKQVEKLLECSSVAAQCFLLRVGNLTQPMEQRLSQVVEVFKRIGLPLHDLLNNPIILRTPVKSLENRFNCLRELGFENISLALINEFSEVMRMTVEDVRQSNMGSMKVHPLDALSRLDVMPSSVDNLVKNHKLRMATIGTIRHSMMLEMLADKLDCSHEDVESVIDKYRYLEVRSIGLLAQTCDVLKNELEFTSKKVLDNLFLVGIESNSITKFMAALPTLRGISTLSLIKKYPRLLSANIEHACEIDALLDTVGVTSTQVIKCGNIYTLSPETVKHRLAVIHETPELKTLQENPRYLHVLYFLPKVLKRLSLLKKKNLPVSVAILTASEGYFQHTLLSDCEKDRFDRFLNYLAGELGTKNSVLKKKMASMLNDFAAANMENVVKAVAVLKNALPNDVIINNLHLVFCCPKLLRNALAESKLSDTRTERLKNEFPERYVQRLEQLQFKYGRPWPKKRPKRDTLKRETENVKLGLD